MAVEYLFTVLAIIFLLPFYGLGINFILNYPSPLQKKEKWGFVIIITALVFSPIFPMENKDGFNNLVSIAGYFILLSALGVFVKSNFYKGVSKGLKYLGYLLFCLAIFYLFIGKFGIELKFIENMRSTNLSVLILLLTVAVEMYSRNVPLNKDES